MAGVSDSSSADAYDVEIKFRYLFNERGIHGDIGYRYMKLKESTFNESTTYKIDGPFIGVSYDYE